MKQTSPLLGIHEKCHIKKYWEHAQCTTTAMSSTIFYLVTEDETIKTIT
jgi:hypothetical protein